MMTQFSVPREFRAGKLFRMIAFRAAAMGLLLTPVASAQEAKPNTPPPADDPKQILEKVLAEAWPDRPEWLDMYTDSLGGSQLGPGDGWFKRAVAQTRFTWKAVQKQYDRNGNNAVGRDEFPGSEADFQRLDRDHDKSLTPADFDFSAHALAPSPGSMFFYRMDTDGNGKVTREELEALFLQADSGGQDFLTLGDLQAAFPAPTQNRPPTASKTPSGPSKETLVKALFRQELGSLQAGPTLGESYVDFTLKTNDGEKEVTFSKLVGANPVVLIFGNFTCGPFRSQAGNVEKLYRMYKDRAEFVMIYVREAHPTDGWHMDSNERAGVSLAQPTTYDERVKVAQACGERLALGFPMLVDTIDDTVGARYSGMPSRIYLVDRDGKIAYKSGRGPFGFKPAELEQSLVLLLQASATESTRQASAPR